MQQNIAPWYLFDFITREVNNTNIALEHSSLEATGKRLDKKEAQFDCFNKFYIQGFGNARHHSYGEI